jgi:L-threonylcarbamoyladenylate synthase
MNENIKKAIEIVKNGGIVIFPTDTAFGIGCRIDDKSAVDRLFSLRNRPLTQATPVLVASLRQALPYLDSVSDTARYFMNTYWPGALTIVTKCKTDTVYDLVRGGGNTIGVRMPDHNDVLEIIDAVGVPILGPSANFHGEKTPFLFEDLNPNLIQAVDFVLPGICKRKIVSTVVDCTVIPYVILRQGAVKLERKTCILHIDSSKRNETILSLSREQWKKEKKLVLEHPSSQQILPLLEALLQENAMTLADISEITVYEGPGSFTGLRVGAAIGMTIAWLLSIPINGKPAHTPIHLDYGDDRWSK